MEKCSNGVRNKTSKKVFKIYDFGDARFFSVTRKLHIGNKIDGICFATNASLWPDSKFIYFLGGSNFETVICHNDYVYMMAWWTRFFKIPLTTPWQRRIGTPNIFNFWEQTNLANSLPFCNHAQSCPSTTSRGDHWDGGHCRRGDSAPSPPPPNPKHLASFNQTRQRRKRWQHHQQWWLVRSYSTIGCHTAWPVDNSSTIFRRSFCAGCTIIAPAAPRSTCERKWWWSSSHAGVASVGFPTWTEGCVYGRVDCGEGGHGRRNSVAKSPNLHFSSGVFRTFTKIDSGRRSDNHRVCRSSLRKGCPILARSSTTTTLALAWHEQTAVETTQRVLCIFRDVLNRHVSYRS